MRQRPSRLLSIDDQVHAHQTGDCAVLLPQLGFVAKVPCDGRDLLRRFGTVTVGVSGAFSRTFEAHDLIVALAWALGAFIFMPVWLFFRGKTSERTLTVSEDGILTRISSMKGEIPWSKVKLIADGGEHILIVGAAGNAFLISARAFQDREQMAQFVERIRSWRGL